MEELRQELKLKNQALMIKYADVIKSIAIKNGKDLGVAFDMLKANARGGNYECDGEYDKEELRKDYEEIVLLSEKILNL